MTQKTDEDLAPLLFPKPADFGNKGSYSVGGPGDRAFGSLPNREKPVPDPRGP